MKQKAFFLSPSDIMKEQRDAKKAERAARKAERNSRPSRSTQTGRRIYQRQDNRVYNCEVCGLSTKCQAPKMGLQGQGRLGILFVGSCPNRTEDVKGTSFIGSAGDFLREKCSTFGIDLDRDCFRINTLQCYPGSDEHGKEIEPTEDQLLSCRKLLLETITQIKPKMIICLGKYATKAIVQPEYPLHHLAIENIHGLTFPLHKYGCWVGSAFHPAFFSYQKDEHINHSALFTDDLAEILAFLNRPLPEPLKPEGNQLILDPDEAVAFLEAITDIPDPVAFDFETNSLSPYIANPRILTMSFAADVDNAWMIPIDYIIDPQTQDRIFDDDALARIGIAMKGFLASTTPKVVQNLNMEGCWSMVIFGQEPNNFVHDTMIGAHILNCRDDTTGLKFQAFRLSGHIYDIGHKDNLNEVPLEELTDYNCFDSRYTYWAFLDQTSRIKTEPDLARFTETYMAAAPALTRFRHRGVLLDVPELQTLQNEYIKVRDEQLQIVNSLPSVQKYVAEQGKPFLITSTPQIGKVLYEYMKQEVGGTTSTGRPAASQAVFPEILKNPASPEVTTFINAIIQYRKVEGSGGILKRIQNFFEHMGPDNRVHPQYTQNIAKTYRSSALDPNIQNVPKHDPIQKQIRRAIVAEPGRILLDCDKSSLEVRIIATESGDPVLTDQLVNKVDFHRDWAIKLYKKSKYKWDELDSKTQSALRYDAKNGFVFASFYGSVPKSIQYYDAFVDAGISLDHIVSVQAEFWNTYKEVRRWQNEVVAQYNANGWFQALPGFKRRGPLSLFQLYNNSTQGCGFIEFVDGLRRVDEETIRRGMKSYLCAEVHDSCTFQAVPEEIEEIVEYASAIFESKRFPWQTVPTPVEWEIGTSWAAMEKL